MLGRPYVTASTLLLALATGLVVCAPAVGQVRFGGQVSWGDDADFAVGARIDAPMASIYPNLRAFGSFDYFFPDDGGSTIDLSYWELTGGVVHIFVIPGSASAQPYAGAGINVARVSVSGGGVSGSDSEAGMAVIAGSRFRSVRITPFVELRLALTGAEQFVLSGGVLF